MTAPPDDPPRLLDHRDAARNRLAALYDPFAREMGVTDTFPPFDVDSANCQQTYAVTASPSPPRPEDDGLLHGRYPPVRRGGLWYPEPVAYLVTQVQCAQVDDIFRDNEQQWYVRYLCVRRHRTRAWIAENFEDVLQEIVTSLIGSDDLRPADRRASNDYRHFLTAWKDTFALTESHRRRRRMDLIHDPADNAIRRMIRAEPREQTNVELDRYETLASVGDRLGRRDVGEFKEVIASHPRLSEKERKIVLSRLVDGLTFADSAAALDLAVSYVHRVYARALTKLAKDFPPNS